MIKEKHINFFCIGAQKSGTSTLFQLLRQHPDVFIPKNKEAHFFDRDAKYIKGIDWYLTNYYEDWSQQKVTGSITPSYMFSEKTPYRIKETLSASPKFIVLLRNPVDRAWSHYLMNVGVGKEKMSFKDAILAEETRLNESEQQWIRFSYIQRGFYYKQLKAYFDLFGKQNFLILNFEEEVLNESKNLMTKVCDFLNIEEIEFNFEIEKNQFKSQRSFSEKLVRKVYRLGGINKAFGDVNSMFKKSEPKPTLNKKTRQQLMEEYFAKDINSLSMLLNFDFNKLWK